MDKKIELLDFLKGFSIFSVVIYHLIYMLPLSGLAKKAFLAGGSGVHTFILISGFGLYLSHLRRKLSFLDFIKKRLSKIYLPYIFIVTVSAIIALFIPIYKNSLYAYFGHVFFYKMFDKSIIASYGYQLWFMSTIIQFYIIFNFLCYLKTILSPVTFFSVGLFVSVIWIVIVVKLGKEEDGGWIRSFLIFLWEFMLGMVLAELYVLRGKFWKIKQVHLLLISFVGIALYALLPLKMGNLGKMMNDIPALFGFTCLGIFIYQLGIKQVNNFFVFTGTISYSLYLIHVLASLIILYILKISGLHFNIVAIALTLIISYFASYFYTKLIIKLI